MVFLVPALAILGFLIVAHADDIEAAPRGLFLALDHATFIGILTNAIFGLILVVTAASDRERGAVDEVVYWGTNLGLAFFIVGLLADQAILKRLGTPVMGTSILLGLAVAGMRLSGRSTPAEGAAAQS